MMPSCDHVRTSKKVIFLKKSCSFAYKRSKAFSVVICSAGQGLESNCLLLVAVSASIGESAANGKNGKKFSRVKTLMAIFG